MNPLRRRAVFILGALLALFPWALGFSDQRPEKPKNYPLRPVALLSRTAKAVGPIS